MRAFPTSLLNNELFNHVRSAFNGAASCKRGHSGRDQSGTLFLDEIGEISHDAQVKLFPVLQEKSFEQVVPTKTIRR